MAITLADRERRLIAAFEDETGASVTDCVTFEDPERAVFVVAAGEMGEAIGPGGRTVKAAEERLGWDIDLVEAADTPEAFVANALAPAAVYDVTVREDGDETVAHAEVPEADRGAAIGTDGRNIEKARRLAERHFGIDDIELA
jgi:N utilization substance protein A